jgi:hypothetical protein
MVVKAAVNFAPSLNCWLTMVAWHLGATETVFLKWNLFIDKFTFVASKQFLIG